MRRIGRFFLILLALVGLLTMTLLGGGLYLGLKVKPESLPQRIVLDLDLDRGVTEAESDNPLAQFEKRRPYVLRRLVETLERAAADGRVVGVMARLSHGNLGMARAQELRDAITVFRKSGKPTVLFADTLGEFGPATLDAYLASAFGQVWLQPSGDVGLTGFVVESPFLREIFDKLGIKPQFAHRGEYKSAIEIFTNSRWSEPARESYQAMLESWSRQVVDGIATSRNLAPEAVRTIVNRSPLTAQEAREAGLVDKLGYYDEAKASIVTGDAKLVDPERYLNRLGLARSEARIAIIYGTGAVQRGQEEEFGLLDKSSGMYSQSIAKAFHDAIEDKAIKAIVFRIDSQTGLLKQVGEPVAVPAPV
ncbi:MAG: S49 family peptidase, partial [Rhodospirillales bacterium]|nr:S49 family peptidase [Rhodospirillales bacterium]